MAIARSKLVDVSVAGDRKRGQGKGDIIKEKGTSLISSVRGWYFQSWHAKNCQSLCRRHVVSRAQPRQPPRGRLP
jgi:hypothetical protein